MRGALPPNRLGGFSVSFLPLAVFVGLFLIAAALFDRLGKQGSSDTEVDALAYGFIGFVMFFLVTGILTA